MVAASGTEWSNPPSLTATTIMLASLDEGKGKFGGQDLIKGRSSVAELIDQTGLAP